MQRPINSLYIFVVLSGLFLSPTQAEVFVYTDRAAWKNAVLAIPSFAHFHDQDFESYSPGPLSTGFKHFLPMAVNIPGTPGFNAIDDSFTPDPFNNELSPNGSTYYLGDVGVNASEAPILLFPELEFFVIGFGADWVVDGELIIEVQGTLIRFDTHLPTGSGFLGIITNRGGSGLAANLLGSAVFGMDNIRTGNVPEPSSLLLCIFALGVVGGWRKWKRAA